MASEATKFSAGARPAGWQTAYKSVHSAPVSNGSATVAVAAFSYTADDRPLQILGYGSTGWTILASLAPPAGTGAGRGLFLAADDPVVVGDVTGDGRPDFVVRLSAAGDIPGIVVSDEPNGWRYVPNAGPFPQSDVVTGQPRIQQGRLVSDFDDCNPNCASGHVSTMVWSYQPTTGVFSAPAPSGWTANAG